MNDQRTVAFGEQRDERYEDWASGSEAKERARRIHGSGGRKATINLRHFSILQEWALLITG